MTTDTIDLSNVTTFPTDVRHPETGKWIRIVDWTKPHEHLSGVFAYVDPDTGEYGGMLKSYDGLSDATPTVETRQTEAV
jgi:hypothetical protein